MNPYRTAIDATTATIDLRARYFRNLIVAVVTIGALTLIAAFATRRLALVAAWLTIVPVCGVFFFVDVRVLNGWRRTLLAAWVALDIDFEVLRRALVANPALPKGTLEGMLTSLPSAGDLRAEQKVQPSTRRALAAWSLAADADRADALLSRIVASAIVVAAIVTAVWLRRWTPLTMLVLSALLPVMTAWRARARRVTLERDLAEIRVQPGFSATDYRRIEEEK